MTDENCIFCKIANGEIPSKTLYEDEQFRVILDLGPATKGHALILPKSHYKNLYELPDATAADLVKKYRLTTSRAARISSLPPDLLSGILGRYPRKQ